MSELFKKEMNLNFNNVFDHKGNSVLHLAVKTNQMSVVEYLIQKGMSSDIRDRLFRTPLHVACMHGFAVIAEYLIWNNLDLINQRDLRGRTCVHFASCAPTSDCLNIIGCYDRNIFSHKDLY